ncbi:MAG TPA: SpoIIE family protein phosphatase [Bacteroidales bacterium]|nr:SpoIIE family protein phosphatase [Bacteroidales bacterium]
MKARDYIIEIGSCKKEKYGKCVCGDTILSSKVPGEERYIAVLSDGLGSGIKASVLSTLTASMNMSFRLRHEPIKNSVSWIMDTLPVDSQRNISYSTFTIVDIDFDGDTMVIEYGNPSFFIVRNNEIIIPERKILEVNPDDKKKNIDVSTFTLLENDRLIVASDGITQSGIGKSTMPFGWGIENLIAFVKDESIRYCSVSASDMAKDIIKKAVANDSYMLKDDASCAVIYRRKPRKLLICSGPPFNGARDIHFSSLVAGFEGRKIICGGTTAKIISRELGKKITVAPIEMMNSDLPPSSSMEGIDLVTEGILTLSRVSEMLKQQSSQESTTTNAAAEIIKMLMEADVIEFLVGTCINVAHQDPSLPVELDIRRNIIRKIAEQLESKYLKQVNIKYL